MRRHTTVSTIGNIDARRVHSFEIADHVLTNAYRFFANSVTHEIRLDGHGANGLPRQQGWHEVGARLLKQTNSLGTGIGTVLNTCDAGFERSDDAVFLVRM